MLFPLEGRMLCVALEGGMLCVAQPEQPHVPLSFWLINSISGRSTALHSGRITKVLLQENQQILLRPVTWQMQGRLTLLLHLSALHNETITPDNTSIHIFTVPTNED